MISDPLSLSHQNDQNRIPVHFQGRAAAGEAHGVGTRHATRYRFQSHSGYCSGGVPFVLTILGYLTPRSGSATWRVLTLK